VVSEERNTRNSDAWHQALSRRLVQHMAGQGLVRGDNAPNGVSAQSDTGIPEGILGQYLVFTLLETECAIKAENIQSVERLVEVTPVPNVAQWIRGVMNLRGAIVSVVDLRAFLECEQLPSTPRTRVLFVQCNEMAICFIVDSVSEMVPIPANAITPVNAGGPGRALISSHQAATPFWAAPYAAGSATVGKRVILLLDPVRLLFSEKIQHYEA
jgi:purine-binding chemotaxis protein CheW